MKIDLLKSYINRLQKQDIINYLNKENIMYSNDEVDLIYNSIKNDYETILTTDFNKYITNYKFNLNDSGIDINKFDEYLDEFDKVIGLDLVRCVHVNDSMNPLGSHKDRHHNIGYGTIGFDALCNVIYNKRLEGIPFILETPWVNRNSKDEYPPYKFEIDNFKNKKFIDFIQ